MKHAIILAAMTIMAIAPCVFAEGGSVGGVAHEPRITSGIGRSSGDGLTALGFTGGTRAAGVGGNASVSSPAFNRSTEDGYSSTGGGRSMVGGRAPGWDDIAGGKTQNPQVVRGIGTTVASPGGRG